jgi:exopolysaccharide biosynthesis polyprenyl glycosylphosphotransferase
MNDGVMLAAAILAAELATPRAWRGVPLVWLFAFPAIVLALLQMRGLYEQRLRLRTLDDMRAIVTTTALASTFTLSLRVLFGSSAHVGAQSVRLWAFAAVYLASGRIALSWWELHVRRNGGAKPTLIVGAGKIGRLVAQRLLEHPEFGLRPVGFLDKEPLDRPNSSFPVLGASWDLERVIVDHRIKHVVVAFSTAPSEVLLREAQRCEKLGVGVSVIPRLFEHVTERATVQYLGGLPLLSAPRTDLSGWQFVVKSAADRLLAGVLLFVALPILAIIALGVGLSGRPIFFRQRRVGRGGRQFEMLKFRSMITDRSVTGAEPLAQLTLMHRFVNDNVAPGGVEGDDRRTRFGSVLRRTSLDELPQLVNVLKGEMSLIGPRPERPEFVRLFERSVPRYADRHRVNPGITGWAQVNGLRGKTSLSDRVEWDNYYIDNWSPWLDIKILLMTMRALPEHFRQAE